MDHLKPPEELNVHASNKAEEWRHFKQHFEVYAATVELLKTDGGVQAAIFLHNVGTEAHGIYFEV